MSCRKAEAMEGELSRRQPPIRKYHGARTEETCQSVRSCRTVTSLSLRCKKVRARTVKKALSRTSGIRTCLCCDSE